MNISAGGVLVETANLPSLRESLDLSFAVFVGSSRSEVLCEGEVVRRLRHDGGPGAFAATITAFRFHTPGWPQDRAPE